MGCMNEEDTWPRQSRQVSSSFMRPYAALILRVASHIFIEVELFRLILQLMRRLVHRLPLILVDQADKWHLGLHCQFHRLEAIVRIMIGGNRRHIRLPHIHGIVERGAWTERVNKREAVMVDALLDQRCQFFWFGRKTSRHKTDIQAERRRNWIEL